MPLLDVSMVLDDPMFNSEFTLVRTKKSITNGRVKYECVKSKINGVFTSVKPEELNRLPAADQANSPVYLYTKTELMIGSEFFGPDEIIFRNKIWQVRDINDWHEYGKGFYKALCIERDPTV